MASPEALGDPMLARAIALMEQRIEEPLALRPSSSGSAYRCASCSASSPAISGRRRSPITLIRLAKAHALLRQTPCP
jgi:hypothetical protein